MAKYVRKTVGVNDPYCHTLPKLTRPTQNTLSKPLTKAEKEYCWFYWLEAIQEPSLTGWILDHLDQIPAFNANWGPHNKFSKRLRDKTFNALHNIDE